MSRMFWKAMTLAITLAALHGARAEAQYGYGYGWGGGYGGGGQTLQGSVARGMGVLAAGAGQYNEETAQARAVNANTAMRWNQYMYESNLTAATNERKRMARRQYGNAQAHAQIYKRHRDNPTSSDIQSGDALNVAFDEINDPRVYAKALASARVKLGGEAIRDIPFAYGAAAITTSIHQVTQGPPPKSLLTPEFAAERAELKRLGAAIHKKTDEGEAPNRADVEKALKVVEAAETRAESVYPANSRDRNEAMKYLKSVHGLLRMMETPALNFLLAGVEKHPEATLAELLTFMNTFNLRFGRALTPRQREVYDMLYPKLVAVRTEIAPALAAAPSPPTGSAGPDTGEIFSGMSTRDLKKTPAPPAPRP